MNDLSKFRKPVSHVPMLGLIGLVVALSAQPAGATRATAGSVDAVATPVGGAPTLVWDGVFATTETAPGQFTPPRPLLAANGASTAGVAVAAAGVRSLAAVEPIAANGAALRSVGVFYGELPPAGQVKHRRVLPSADAPRTPVLATSAAGDALLAWNQGPRVAVDRKLPGGGLRPPVVAGRFTLSDAAVDDAGLATVIGYRDSTSVLVTSARRGGAFGATEALPSSPGQAQVAAGPSGAAAVVTADSTTGLHLFYRAGSGERFGAAQALVATPVLTIVGTAVGSAGRVLVAWTALDASQHVRLRAMITDPGGQPTTAVDLSAPGRDVPSGHATIATNRDGAAAAIWEETEPPGGTPRVFASYRLGGAAFGPARQVTAAGRHSVANAPPAIAMDGDGDATLLWSEALDPSDSDQRFMAAHLTAAGLSDGTRVDAASPLPGAPPSTPPLLRATITSPASRTVSAGGRFQVRLRCVSWTLAPCHARLAVVRGAGGRKLAGRSVELHPNSSRGVTLRLNGAGRRALASARSLRATIRVRLRGKDAAGARKRLTLRARGQT